MGQVQSSSEFEVKINQNSATRDSPIVLKKGSSFDLLLYCYSYSNTYAPLSVDGIITKRRYSVRDSEAIVVDSSRHFEKTLLRPGSHTLRVTFVTESGTVLDVIEVDLLITSR